MDHSTSSIIITQRERFAPSLESLESLLATIPPHTQVVYVDAGSPPPIARELERASAEHDFLLLRSERYLAPNEARNLALRHVESDFVTFVDNDLLFEPGWLEQLIACAEETGAWLVTPIIVQQGKHGLVWHMVGGDCGISDHEGRRRFREDHSVMGHAVGDAPSIDRQPTGFVEFHCVLVARPAFDACFPLDEELRSSRDHCDLTLDAHQHDGAIWLEPAVTVTQLFMPDRLPATDRRFYALRWSDPWNRRSLERFRDKWDLDPDDPLDHHDLVWLSAHRLYGNRAYGGAAGKLPNRARRIAMRVADRAGQSLLRAKRSTLHPPAPELRAAHQPAWCDSAATSRSA